MDRGFALDDPWELPQHKYAIYYWNGVQWPHGARHLSLFAFGGGREGITDWHWTSAPYQQAMLFPTLQDAMEAREPRFIHNVPAIATIRDIRELVHYRRLT